MIVRMISEAPEILSELTIKQTKLKTRKEY
jgi:hypothetical protein